MDSNEEEIIEILTREVRLTEEKFRARNEENRFLNEENRALNEENRALNEENRSLNEENRAIIKEKKTLSMEFQKTMSRIDKIESMLELLCTEVESMQQKLSDFQHQYSKVDENLEEVMNLKEEIRDVLLGEVTDLKVEFEDTSSRIEEIDNKLKKMSEGNEVLIESITGLEQKNREKEKYLAGQKENTATLQKNLNFIHAKLIDIDDKMRRNNLRIIGLPEEENTPKMLDIMVQKVIQENCPELLITDKELIKVTHRSPPTKNPMFSTPRHVIVTFYDFNNKQTILRASRRRMFKYEGTPIRITEDYSGVTRNKRREWSDIFQKAKELKLKPRMLYPSKLSIILNEEKLIFNTKEAFEEFLKESPAMSRIFT
ncbi:LINE-1 type transposase domain-containing protein 1 [Gracilinanus agilis]|uniref:LINE-1 type transposase domain-containing protein 1 n=1 Tax=Gracilinanus agilis TaxID=191870 RepID=UPI001CFC8192|nr:LINE-1 type transposase domain-containing protein 1 [Gracilinanus agilis]